MMWSDTGVLGELGELDFAGRTPVHTCSGATATAMSLNFKPVMAMCVINLCASAGAMKWARLVLITPSAGFINLTTSFSFGVGGALICRQAL
jgi:ammonia channel protein AmtB